MLRVVLDVVGDDQTELLAAVQRVDDDLARMILNLAPRVSVIRRGAVVLLTV